MEILKLDQLNLEVFTRKGITGFNFESAKIIDAVVSLVVNWNYATFDDFELEIPLTNENLVLFANDNIIRIVDRYFFIDKVEGGAEKDSDDSSLKISGKSLLAKADTRIIDEIYDVTNKLPESIAYELLARHVVAPTLVTRKISYLSLLPVTTFGTTPLTFQTSYDNVMTKVANLMDSYKFGVREKFTNMTQPANSIEFYKGQDVSNIVEFSVGFDNLTDETYEHSTYDWSTTAVVLGAGEGTARKRVLVGGDASGLERREIQVDARDQQQGQYSESQYHQLLTDRGNTELATRREVLEINGSIALAGSLFQFKKDYDVGDRVRISSRVFNLTKTSVITAMQESWDNQDGHQLHPTFGDESPAIYKIYKRS